MAVVKTYLIYCATNKVNGKKYVGYTSNFELRRYKHEWHAINEPNGHFHRALRKYGLGNFEWEILFESNNKELTLLTKEEEFIRLKNSHARDGHGYNYSYGGNGSGFYMTHEQRVRAAQTKLRNGITPTSIGATEAARIRNTDKKQTLAHKINKAASKMRKVEINGIIYKSGTDAAKSLGVSKTRISNMIHKGIARKYEKCS